jgi:hypothetical protein
MLKQSKQLFIKDTTGALRCVTLQMQNAADFMTKGSFLIDVPSPKLKKQKVHSVNFSKYQKESQLQYKLAPIQKPQMHCVYEHNIFNLINN